MGNPHKCQTYDFPVNEGTFDYSFDAVVVKQMGGKGIDAVKDAVDKAKTQATDEGEKAMKDETCEKPCDRLIYVDVTITMIDPKYTNPGKTHLTTRITGIWKAGILCFTLEAKGESKTGKSGGKSSGKE